MGRLLCLRCNHGFGSFHLGTGFYAGNYPNRSPKWEETNSYNIGLDLALFDNRVELIADAYYKKTDNLLMQASLPM